MKDSNNKKPFSFYLKIISTIILGILVVGVSIYFFVLGGKGSPIFIGPCAVGIVLVVVGIIRLFTRRYSGDTNVKTK